MNRPTVALAVFFLFLAALGAHLVSVASQEQRERTIPASAMQTASFFTGLQACDVPNLRERILSSSPNTIAFAGEFRPAKSIPWVLGKHRVYLYVVSGTGSARIDNTFERIYPGDLVVLPAGVYHAVVASTSVMRAIYIEET